MDSALTEAAWLQLSETADRKRIAAVFKTLHAAGHNPILIKGWSIARFFDAGHGRASTDIDLMFPGNIDSETLDFLKQLNLRIVIDAHFGPRRLDHLAFDDLYARSYEVELDNVPIRVLGDEDNLRISAVHWLTDGGVYKEKLWDIFYLVKNRKPDFDWERCLESNGPIRKTWVLAAIATARDHLDLDVSQLPQEAQLFRLPGWYTRTLAKEWRLGPYPRRILSTVLTRPRLLAEQLRRKLPPNPIAASIDTERPIDETSRLTAQVGSLTKKIRPFARGLARRITYSLRGSRK